tara:strand:+ start:135 stop:368 length:234 start_codon:yes stop_codon:yes gene_type:complete
MYNKETEQTYYLLSLHDLYEGIEIEVLETALEDMEVLEQYEMCGGISKAIRFAKNNTREQLIQEYDDTLDRLAEESD